MKSYCAGQSSLPPFLPVSLCSPGWPGTDRDPSPSASESSMASLEHDTYSLRAGCDSVSLTQDCKLDHRLLGGSVRQRWEGEGGRPNQGKLRNYIPSFVYERGVMGEQASCTGWSCKPTPHLLSPSAVLTSNKPSQPRLVDCSQPRTPRGGVTRPSIQCPATPYHLL